MSATNYLETAILELLFQAESIPNLADNASTSPATQLYVSLHTADPGEAGDQNSNEADYTSYARVAVNRDNGAWTVSGDTVQNASNIAFPQCTGGANIITHAGIGLSATGPGTLLVKGPLNTSLSVSVGIAPLYLPGEFKVQVD